MTSTDRRQFLAAGTTAAIAGGALLASIPGFASADDKATDRPADISARWNALIPGAIDDKGEYVVPKLNYGYDAVAEVIDAATMEIHHTKHHAKYVKDLKATEEALAKAHATGEYDNLNQLATDVAFNGAGHMLHCIFWDSIGPDKMGGEPTGDLSSQITKDFGGYKMFWAHFSGAAKKVQGSGWGILAWSYGGNKLVIMQAHDHQANTQWGIVPLLAIDVWEHAYYLKYKNDRAAYVDGFAKIINWNRIEHRYGLLRG